MPDSWTVQRVELILIEECRRAPDGRPIQLPLRFDPMRPKPLPHASWGEIEGRLNWRARFFDKVTVGDWFYLLAWAQCRASGESWSERIRARDWGRKAAENGRQRAARVIAEGLNAARANPASVAASEAARARRELIGRTFPPQTAGIVRKPASLRPTTSLTGEKPEADDSVAGGQH